MLAKERLIMGMRPRRIAAGVLAASLLTIGPKGLFAQTPEFRAFFADAWHAGMNSTGEVDSMISRAKAGRYNAIFVQVLAYHDRSESIGGAYWNSNVLPRHFSSFDPLSYLCQQAHLPGNDLEVHAWIIPYRVGGTYPPSTYGNPTLHNHPEWFMSSYPGGSGATSNGGDYYLDPGSPDVQEYVISIVHELVTNYPIDGIHWDYIRYLDPNYGYPSNNAYANSGLARFYRITPLESQCAQPPPYSSCPAWDDFRRRGITELVRRTRGEIAAATNNPRQPLRHTGSLFTTGDCPTSFSSTSAYSNKFSNWEEWLRLGYLDAGCPMVYDREHCAAQAQYYRNWIDRSLGWRYSRQMYFTQAPYLNTMDNSFTQLRYARDAGADGISTYNYVGTVGDTTGGCDSSGWSTDWSWYTSVANNVFTWGAPRPSMPWRNPATATEGTLWGRVTDGAGQPVDDASVSLIMVGSVRTDGNGYYTYTLINATAGGAAYTAKAQKTGLGSRTYPVTVYAGGLTRQDFNLSCNPTVSIAADRTSIVERASVHFTPTVSYAPGNTAASYVWHFGAETLSGSGTPTAVDRTFSNTGDFGCYLVVTDSAGCTGESNHINIHVDSGAPQVIVAAEPTTINAGQSVHFTPSVTYGPGASGASFVWHFDAATVSGSGVPTPVDQTFSTAGDIACYLVVTDTLARSGESNHLTIRVNAVMYSVGDFDHDGDVDLTDFSMFQTCFNGPNRAYGAAPQCPSADNDHDGDVDLSDFAAFQYCFNGPNRPAAQTSCYY
jgi:uncharacterized lipoprotein YddW (UPF0748 family)